MSSLEDDLIALGLDSSMAQYVSTMITDDTEEDDAAKLESVMEFVREVLPDADEAVFAKFIAEWRDIKAVVKLTEEAQRLKLAEDSAKQRAEELRQRLAEEEARAQKLADVPVQHKTLDAHEKALIAQYDGMCAITSPP